MSKRKEIEDIINHLTNEWNLFLNKVSYSNYLKCVENKTEYVVPSVDPYIFVKMDYYRKQLETFPNE